MSIITDQKIVINKNFEQAINEVKSPTGDKASIPYRDWMEERKQVEVFKVPIEYCRYRLENGRISIETSSYSVTTKPLDQDSPEDQEKIAEYLNDDKKNNEILKTLLRKDGQTAVAVITADGYLINGNRRKLILGQLFNEKKEEKFKYIKVNDQWLIQHSEYDRIWEQVSPINPDDKFTTILLKEKGIQK